MSDNNPTIDELEQLLKDEDAQPRCRTTTHLHV